MGVESLGRFKDIIYRGRDMFELAGKIPRNSAVGNIAHLLMGAGIVGGVALAQYKLLPKESAVQADTGAAAVQSDKYRMTRLRAMQLTDPMVSVGSAAVVLLTAGMQLAAKGGRGNHLARGLSPMYFLGVGAYGGQKLIAEPLRQALER